MPRRGGVPKRDVLPDPIYNSKVITKLINQLLIREAIRKIALGRSMERINLAPGGMSGDRKSVV